MSKDGKNNIFILLHNTLYLETQILDVYRSKCVVFHSFGASPPPPPPSTGPCSLFQTPLACTEGRLRPPKQSTQLLSNLQAFKWTLSPFRAMNALGISSSLHGNSQVLNASYHLHIYDREIAVLEGSCFYFERTTHFQLLSYPPQNIQILSIVCDV